MKNLVLVFMSLAVLISTSACSKNEDKKPNKTIASQPAPPAPAPAPEKLPVPPTTPRGEPIPRSEQPRPAQQEVEDYPRILHAQLIEKGTPAFSEPITVRFERDGLIFGRHLYALSKSFVGPKDNRAFWWWQESDDLNWSTPFKVISVNLRTMKILGGDEVDEGVVIGEIFYNGRKFKLNFSVPLTIEKATMTVHLVKSPQVQTAQAECPQAVKFAKMCELYQGIYGALSAVDFSAMGEIGPDVASDVVNVSTAFNLAKSIYTFKPDVDSVRSKYLIPLLKSIGQLKALQKIDKNDRAVYLQKNREAYSYLIVTAFDTTFKTQKLAPEMALSTSGTALGVVLGYIGLNSAADKMISKGQPAWFRDLIAPIIRETGVVMIDLVSGESGNPLQERVDRLIAMEDQIRGAVIRLCKSAPVSATNECVEALNQ